MKSRISYGTSFEKADITKPVFIMLPIIAAVDASYLLIRLLSALFTRKLQRRFSHNVISIKPLYMTRTEIGLRASFFISISMVAKFFSSGEIQSSLSAGARG